MIKEIFYTFIKSTVTYILLLFLTRVMGRKLISQMTFFDFIVGITIGTLGGTLIIGPNITYISAVTAIVSFSILAVISAYLHIKSFKVRKLIDSEPVVLIDKGQIVNKNMKKIRLTIDELLMKLREKEMFNAADVEFAIMETDGELSVLPKAGKEPVTTSDLNISTTTKGLTKDIIIDGKILIENLREANKSEKWLYAELKTQNVKDIKDIFYAGLDSSDNLYISKKIKGNEKPGKYGIE